MKDKDNVFLNKISEKISNGLYDEYVSLFVSRELIYTAIKAKINKKIETNGTPLLTDAEIKEAIKDAKETGTNTLKLFLEIGAIVKVDDNYILSEKGIKLIRAI